MNATKSQAGDQLATQCQGADGVPTDTQRACCSKRCSAGIGTSGFQSSSGSRCSACAAALAASPLKSPAPLRPLLPAGASRLGDAAAASAAAPIFVLALAEGRRVLALTAATAPLVACGSSAIAASLRQHTAFHHATDVWQDGRRPARNSGLLFQHDAAGRYSHLQ